jgi:hypothetical protein
MKNVLVGVLIASGAALLLLLVTVGGENGWKFALAAVGLVLWVIGGLSKQS